MVDGFYFGSYPDSKYKTEAIIGIIDSGSPVISGPEVNIKFIKKILTANMTGTTTDAAGNTFFSCSKYQAGLPSLFFRFGDYWLEVQSSDYAVISAGDTCQLLLGVSENYWIIGLPALRGYYTTFDMQNDQVLIVPQADSTKKSPIYGPAGSKATVTPLNDPSTMATSGSGSGSTTITTEQLMLIVAVVLLIIVIVYVVEQNGGTFSFGSDDATIDEGNGTLYKEKLLASLNSVETFLSGLNVSGLDSLWDEAVQAVTTQMLL